MQPQNIIIRYPNDFDGELHIKVNEMEYNCHFEFCHSTSESATGIKDATPWQTLVAAAKAILAQESRIRKPL